MISINTKSSRGEIPRARENGIAPVSWEGWPNYWIADGVHLFLEGFAAPDDAGPNAPAQHDRRGEAVIELYRRKGTDFLQSLRGTYAFALWDSRAQKLIVATDYFGTRSVYYWTTEGRIAFAPRIAQLVRHEVSRAIDPNSVYFFLNHSFIPAPFTIYKNVRRLEPGQFLTWEAGKLAVQKYWDMVYDEDQTMTEAAAAAALRQSLTESVDFNFTRHCRRAAEVGSFLSGGTDSSTLVGLLSRKQAEPIKSFSVGFEEAAYNEIHYARVAARHFKSDAHEYFVKPAEALDALDAIAAAYDEPFGNSSAIPTFFCLKMARESGVKVMFAGDGGDELYGGNERYITDKIFTLYHEVPRPARAVIDRCAEIMPAGYPWRKIKNYVRKANQPAIERFFAYQLYFRDHAASYFTDGFRESIDREFPLDVPRQHYSRAGEIAALNRLLYVDLKLAIADNDLFKVNRMADIHGVQVLYPYLDPNVGIVSGTIPARLKVKGWSKRYIFKKAFADLLPQEIIKKKKHGFGLPTGDWLRHHPGFRDLARSLLLDGRSLQRGYFKRPAIEGLLEMHDRETSSYYGSHIWSLMMLELWHRHHIDGFQAENEARKF